MDYQCTQAEEVERNRVHEETIQMLQEMIKIQEEKQIFEEAARQEDEKRIAIEKEAAELEAKRKSQECLNIEEKSIPQASIRSRKSRIDPTLSNFTVSTKRIPLSDFIPPVTPNVKTVNSLKMGDKHLDTQKGSLESSVKDPIPIPRESDIRMGLRVLFTRIVRELSDNCPYFQEGRDAVGKTGISGLVKYTSAIRQLAYERRSRFSRRYIYISGEKTST
ncbi:hypothetical protein Tco_0004823 [Tanacetum coccineum]